MDKKGSAAILRLEYSASSTRLPFSSLSLTAPCRIPRLSARHLRQQPEQEAAKVAKVEAERWEDEEHAGGYFLYHGGHEALAFESYRLRLICSPKVYDVHL